MKYHRTHHRDEPTWITHGRDYAQPEPEPRRSGLLEVFGNIVCTLLFFVGILILIAVLHYAPDSAILEALR